MPLANGSTGPSQRGTIVRILLALVVIAVVAVAGVYFVRHRNASANPPKPSTEATGQTPLPSPEAPACGEGDALLSALSTRDKLAQLLMVGVTGADDARAVVANDHVGGIFLGSWTDMSMLTDGSLPEIAASADPLPLAVSVDEEGGRVQRLSKLIGSQPSPRELAQTHTPAEVHDIALKRGQAMKQLGITVDFAPVVDVTTEADDEVIGDRSFGADPATVVEYAGAYAQGLRDAGLLPVLKHFPGHGHGSGDSHLGDVTTPGLADLQASDLVPYRTLTTEAPIAVMVGHLEVPGLTTDQPTSLTPAAYDLLRSGNYGGPPFGGPVFTDDLSSMKAISDHFGVPDAALRALQAGADVALWVTTDEVPAVLDRLTTAVNSGELDMARVDQSVLRVSAFKGKSPRCGG
jgi:beta-N-acetylhexosaminidase